MTDPDLLTRLKSLRSTIRGDERTATALRGVGAVRRDHQLMKTWDDWTDWSDKGSYPFDQFSDFNDFNQK